MIINEISSTLVQRYGENQINAILNRNISYLTHHIKKICEFVYDEGIDISKVQQAFQQYEQLKKQGDAFDYRNLSFSEFVNKLQTLTISVQLPNVIFTSNDKMIQIGRFDTFEEANSFQKQTNITCCFCTNKVWWNIYKGHGAELYIIHNLYQSCKSRLRYVIVVILANKKPYFFDMNDKSLRKERGIEVYSKYIASLNGAERYLLENKNINCNRNMNNKLIRLTESDLHRIVRESVNKVLNEIGNSHSGSYQLGRVYARAKRNGKDDVAKRASNGAKHVPAFLRGHNDQNYHMDAVANWPKYAEGEDERMNSSIEKYRKLDKESPV